MRSFHRLCFATLIAVYVLILVGGIVRSSGSGMGCPDWPRCFGRWVPPTSVEELPDDYQSYYVKYRHRKNLRFAKYLTAFGLDDTANELIHDESIREETAFNPAKTWIEYFNRLVGVTIGFLIFAVAATSLRFWKRERAMTLIAVLSFLLVAFQGWLGSIVVSTNLTPWTITLHMFLALLIVVLLVYLTQRSGGRSDQRADAVPAGWVLACMGVLSIQILWGTRVRESIDQISAELARSEWISSLGLDFFLHRSFSWVVLILHVGLITKLVKTQSSKVFPLTLILLILGTILSGTGMAYFAVPPYLQPVHLLMATATFGMLSYLLFEIVTTKKTSLAQ
ncbi:MAG TPA: COX15/CtaA family protein [Cyclobacteriaceae bacterium]|nr:COX15/CtaA family protein [Cyclobacteriaceae bacterium]